MSHQIKITESKQKKIKSHDTRNEKFSETKTPYCNEITTHDN
jgi:hypothetical protein